jgi:hypothetical protein
MQYRWNFVEKGDDPYISKAKPTVEKKEYNVDVILKIDETKTRILNSYATKQKCFTELGITKKRLNKIIDENIKHNGFYYVFHKNCPKELLKDYSGMSLRAMRTEEERRIERIDCATKQSYIFENYSEIKVRLGYKMETIRKAIISNTLYNGFIWRFYDEPDNKKN